jgi:hypothetical protein
MLNPDAQRAWRWAGWFCFALTAAGVADWIIAWIPMRLGILEWEFGTITATFSGIPLVAIGLAGMLASAVARGARGQILGVSSFILLLSAVMIGALVIFLLDVPVALQAVDGVARLGIMKATAKTLSMGLIFIPAFIAIAVAAIRYVGKSGG